ncbi:hypothetical protein [Nonomuraea africana]|uniref:hypothetical protein n=1 Tax=Nonomuraea africana TaxID=46171 RepID=UPI0033FFE30D
MDNVNPAPNAGPSPYMYDLADQRTGGLPEDPTYAAGKQDLAKVSVTFRVSGTAAPSTLKLELSSDDGTNWRAIPVHRTATGWTAMVPNPRTPSRWD